MKKIILGIAALLVAGSLGMLFVAGGLRTIPETQTYAPEVPDPSDFLSMRPQLESLPAQTVSDTERTGLLIMREEEKLARDVYRTLYEKWGLPIFNNIAQSEQTHTEAVRALLEKYGISDPVADDSVGIFANDDFSTLYASLVAQGEESVEGALTVGALIEDLDIGDLKRHIAEADNDDIRLVYENLMRGSRNHMRSFVGQLSSLGATYQPAYITQDEFYAIISSSREIGTQETGNRGWRAW